MPKITFHQNQIKTQLAKQLPRFPYFDSTELNNAINGTLAPGGYMVPEYQYGATFELWGGANAAFAGARFQYVYVDPRSAALAVGNNVMFSLPIAGTVTASGSTTSAIKTNIDTTTLTGGVKGTILSIFDTAKSIITMRQVIGSSNGAGTATIGTNTIFTIANAPDSLITNEGTPVDALTAIPTNGVPCQLIFPNWITLYDHNNLIYPSAGFALGTVTAGNPTLIQKSGFGQALMVGGGTAVVSGAPVAPSGVTDGLLIGSATWQASSPGLAQMASSTTVQLMPLLITNTAE